MVIERLRPLLATAIMLCSTAALHAQLPVNNDVWKARCNLLASAVPGIENGSISPVLVAATRGIPGAKFHVLAVNRSDAGEHYVACSFYYLAAIADRVGNGGKADVSAANDDAVLAGADVKEARGESLAFSERMKRTSLKIQAIGGGLTLNGAETKQVPDAAGTMPLSLTPSAPNTELATLPSRKR